MNVEFIFPPRIRRFIQQAAIFHPWKICCAGNPRAIVVAAAAADWKSISGRAILMAARWEDFLSAADFTSRPMCCRRRHCPSFSFYILVLPCT